jgi:hypothetical protein
MTFEITGIFDLLDFQYSVTQRFVNWISFASSDERMRDIYFAGPVRKS